MAPPLTGPSGLKVAVTAPFRVQPHTLVSHVYDYPEVIVRWADGLYHMEGNRNANLSIDDDWGRLRARAGGLGRERYQQALDAKRAATQ